jgi:hypothetical protein
MYQEKGTVTKQSVEPFRHAIWCCVLTGHARTFTSQYFTRFVEKYGHKTWALD